VPEFISDCKNFVTAAAIRFMKHKGKGSIRQRRPNSDEAQSGEVAVAGRDDSGAGDDDITNMKEVEEIRFLRRKWEQNAPNSGSQPTE
jgi:hypothetical protein